MHRRLLTVRQVQEALSGLGRTLWVDNKVTQASGLGAVDKTKGKEDFALLV